MDDAALPLHVKCSQLECGRRNTLSPESHIYLYVYREWSWLNWFVYVCRHCRNYSYEFMWSFGSSQAIFDRLVDECAAVVMKQRRPDTWVANLYREVTGCEPYRPTWRTELREERAELRAAIHELETVEPFLT